jgi:hypothetical protein
MLNVLMGGDLGLSSTGVRRMELKWVGKVLVEQIEFEGGKLR